MTIHVYDDYESMCRSAADFVCQSMDLHSEPLLCPASGSSPVGVYHELSERYRQGRIDSSQWYVISLDEWIGMNGTIAGSCRHSLNHQLLQPLSIAEERILFFDGLAADPGHEQRKLELFLDNRGPIDLSVLGIGMNGHIGFNEPGTSVELRSVITDLDDITIQTGQKYFQEPKELKRGISLGFATLLQSKRIILIANGQHKAPLIRRLMSEDPGTSFPASMLKSHHELHLFLDAAAAELIR